MNIFLIILIPTLAICQTQLEEAKLSIESLIRPLISLTAKNHEGKQTKFRVDECLSKKIDFVNLLMNKTESTIEFKFSDGCDIEGIIHPKILAPFQTKLNLRNLKTYTQIETIVKITANLENPPNLILEMRNGLLTGKDSLVKFETDYKTQINFKDNKEAFDTSGGEIRISEINGHKVNIKEKIYIK